MRGVGMSSVDEPEAAAAGGREVPEHPRVPDALARSVIAVLFDDDAGVGVALVRATDWTHVLASRLYERLLGSRSPLGLPIRDVIPERVAPAALLESVVETGKAATGLELLVRPDFVAGSPVSVHVATTFLRVRRVTPGSDGVLVLVQDVSRQVHERRMGELFAALAHDLSDDRDEAASIRSSVVHASEALRADAASLFLLDEGRKNLRGALVGWDWTRTSFTAEVEHWPSVARAIEANEACWLSVENARGNEVGWFERRGIAAAICAPMAARGRVLGVLFFDFRAAQAARVDLRLAKEVADQCARLVEREAART